MKITISLLDKLERLREGQSLPASSLKGAWVEELLRDGVLVSRSYGSRRVLCAANPQCLEKSLGQIDERLADLDGLKNLLSFGASRSEQAINTGNSKLVSARSCPGFPVNCYEPIKCCLDGKFFSFMPLEGTFLYVCDWTNFSIPQDVVVVGVENMENFRYVGRQRYLFEAMFPGKQLLFVSRYPQSTDLRSWLQSIPNKYVHFGDFDLAGINIFISEFYKFLGDRATFLIPSDIEERLKKGSSLRYKDQYQRFKGLSVDKPYLQNLIDMIHFYHKCYDQEGYICS